MIEKIIKTIEHDATITLDPLPIPHQLKVLNNHPTPWQSRCPSSRCIAPTGSSRKSTPGREERVTRSPSPPHKQQNKTNCRSLDIHAKRKGEGILVGLYPSACCWWLPANWTWRRCTSLFLLQARSTDDLLNIWALLCWCTCAVVTFQVSVSRER
ncbi:uncharacterized protein LOC135168398 [Diachasmimorpha longicaudata]|uniref:uncharacterized protein LOC135168398 n=1 Tax=Diachasmimorpha longicaudata TaxID=58733 RepID=UPI0030B870AA